MALGGIERIPQLGAGDVERVAVLDRRFLDGGKDHHGRIVPVGMERGDRFFAVLFLVLGKEVLVAGAESREVRAGVVHADRSVTGGFVEVRGERAVGAHQGGLFEAGHFLCLAGEMAAGGDEDREVDELGLAGGDLGQHRAHVGVGRGHGLLGRDGAAQLFEGFGEHRLQLLGVDAAVMDGGGFLDTQFFESKLGRHGALDLVVVGGAQVAVILLAALGVGQVRGGVGGRHRGDAGLPEDRCARSGSAGAVGADGGDDGRVGGELGGRRLPAFRVAAFILAAQLDRVAEKLAALVLNGEFNAAPGVDSQRRIPAGHHHPVGDVDRLALLDGDDSDRVLGRGGLGD